MLSTAQTLGQQILARSTGDWISNNGDWLTAAVTLLATFALARTVDYLIGRHARPVALAVSRGEITPITVTRLRLVRRLVFVAIIVIGVALAISPFGELRRLTTGLLASSAVLGIVIGFAARQTLANGIAGIQLAIVQPFRIGDVIEWEGSRGEVEDITLTYTYVRLPDKRRLVIPNERVASGPIFNYSIGELQVDAQVRVWVGSTEAVKAIEVLRQGVPGSTVEVSQIDRDKTELVVSRAAFAEDQASISATMRERALSTLVEADLLSAPEAG